MLDAQSTNATATFYTATEGATTGPYDDPDGDWQAVHADVRVLWDPKGTEFRNTETGDHLRREDRVFAPLELAHDHEPGDRVDVLPDYVASVYGSGPYSETTYGGADPRRLRITGSADKTLDGLEGFWELTVRDAD